MLYQHKFIPFGKNKQTNKHKDHCILFVTSTSIGAIFKNMFIFGGISGRCILFTLVKRQMIGKYIFFLSKIDVKKIIERNQSVYFLC